MLFVFHFRRQVRLGGADLFGNPLGRLADLMIDAGLLLDGAPEPGRGDPDEGPTTLDVDNQGSAAIPETSIL